MSFIESPCTKPKSTVQFSIRSSVSHLLLHYHHFMRLKYADEHCKGEHWLPNAKPYSYGMVRRFISLPFTLEFSILPWSTHLQTTSSHSKIPFAFNFSAIATTLSSNSNLILSLMVIEHRLDGYCSLHSQWIWEEGNNGLPTLTLWSRGPFKNYVQGGTFLLGLTCKVLLFLLVSDAEILL